MIFLTVGNWHKGFDRLVRAVDDLKVQDIITEEIIAQIGSGNYKPKYLIDRDYYSPEAFASNIDSARVIITHAGIGTISYAVNLRKPVIVVPRKASLGEHYDDHQFATAEALEAEHKVLVAREISELPNMLQKAKSFVPAKGQSGQEIIRVVETFIKRLQNQKCNRTGNE